MTFWEFWDHHVWLAAFALMTVGWTATCMAYAVAATIQVGKGKA